MNLAVTLPLADNWGMHDGWGAGWMLVMMPMILLFWGAIIFGVVWFIRAGGQGGSTHAETHTGSASPLEILDRRFAEGSLTVEDYRARREVLISGPAERGNIR